MKALNLKLRSNETLRDVTFPVKRMVNAGYTARDQEGVRKHIEELKEMGVPAPEAIPTIYPVASYLITTGGVLEVVEPNNSGKLSSYFSSRKATCTSVPGATIRTGPWRR